MRHLRRVKSKGRVYWYHRKTGERLPDDETARLTRLLEINATLAPAKRIPAESVAALVALYRASPAFMRLAERTRHFYVGRLDFLVERWGPLPVGGITRRHVIDLRDRFAETPALADRTVAVLRLVLAFAIEREWRPDNPALGVPKLRPMKDVEGHRPWPNWAVDRFLAAHSGNTMGLALLLGLYTGQRLGDVLKMRWADISDGYITVKQSKTKTGLQIPLHAALASALGAHKKASPIILTTPRGMPFGESGFRGHFARAIRDAGLAGNGLTFHGLRYAAAIQLADVGCTPHQIAAITGHKSLAMVAKYSAGANQRRLAAAAIMTLEREQNKKLENGGKGSGKPDPKPLKAWV